MPVAVRLRLFRCFGLFWSFQHSRCFQLSNNFILHCLTLGGLALLLGLLTLLEGHFLLCLTLRLTLIQILRGVVDNHDVPTLLSEVAGDRRVHLRIELLNSRPADTLTVSLVELLLLDDALVGVFLTYWHDVILRSDIVCARLSVQQRHILRALSESDSHNVFGFNCETYNHSLFVNVLLATSLVIPPFTAMALMVFVASSVRASVYAVLPDVGVSPLSV